MDLSIDLSSILAAGASAVGGLLVVIAKRQLAARVEQDRLEREAAEKRHAETTSAIQSMATAQTAQVSEFRDFRAAVNARFDALQTSVDGHAREIEIGRDSRAKLYTAQDKVRERVVRLETIASMHTPVHGTPAVREQT